MTHTPHALHEDFPEFGAKISALKLKDPDFSKLTEAYHELNRTVHRMETGLEAVADDVLEDMKKRRIEMKDRIASQLIQA